MELSIVIPAYNETRYIENLLKSIHNFSTQENDVVEILVIDNGSTDNTSELASNNGAKVHKLDRGSISRARNTGVEKASYELIAFIDADIILTQEWFDTVKLTCHNTLSEFQVLGAKYAINENPTWVESSWFEPLSKKPATYINGGNILVSKTSFSKIGGFSESLETGEDYEFCHRAKQNGANIVFNKGLVAIHDGFPKDSVNFFKREAWHGKGDFTNLKTFLSSKVALISMAFFSLITASVVSLLLMAFELSVAFAGMSLGLVVLINLIVFRMDKSIGNFLFRIPLCTLYLIARTYSLKKVLSTRFG